MLRCPMAISNQCEILKTVSGGFSCHWYSSKVLLLFLSVKTMESGFAEGCYMECMGCNYVANVYRPLCKRKISVYIKVSQKR